MVMTTLHALSQQRVGMQKGAIAGAPEPAYRHLPNGQAAWADAAPDQKLYFSVALALRPLMERATYSAFWPSASV